MTDMTKKPPVMKQSRGKIWIRTLILIVFTTIFGIAVYQDIMVGRFYWLWAAILFTVCFVIGFPMSRIVPMQVHGEFQVITFSFDRIYFILIWILVIGKLVAGNLFAINIIADVIMSGIVGLMMGRLSGICLRVHSLKKIHFHRAYNNLPDNGQS